MLPVLPVLRHSALALLPLVVALPAYAVGPKTEVLNSEAGALEVTTLASGLQRPWALAFLPAQQGMLVTERTGALRLVNPAGQLSAPLAGVPKVWANGQGGLLDVVLSPDFATDRLVYLSYAEAADDGATAGTAVGRGRLSDDGKSLEQFQVIFRQAPKLSVGNHFGARLVFDREGYLFIALGENNDRISSQDLGRLQGKVVRIFPDGRIPPDNPFVNKAGARPEIWSYGHRNQQGAALNPWNGTVWTNEHGPRGGDELNLVERGGNYGWPLATHGINYNGQPIPEARGKTLDGGIAPFHVWEQSPGLSGLAFYDNPRFPKWQHSAFMGSLVTRDVIRVQFKGDLIVHEERLLGTLQQRIRDVRQGPDGYLYVLTDADAGQLLKVGLR